MNVLITGATGFIGSNLAKALFDSGHKISLLVRPSSDLSGLSIGKKELSIHIYDGSYSSISKALSQDNIDLVIHCASLFLSSHREEDVERLIDSNIKFPSMLLESMVQHGVHKFINTGTSWQHYNDESYNPVNLYAATKQAFDDIVRYYLEVNSIACITLKLFDTYGPNDGRGKLIGFLIKQIKEGGHVDMSPGEQEISLVHIDDVVTAYKLAIKELLGLKKGSSREYGICSADTYKLRVLIKTIIKECNSDIPLHVNFGGFNYRDREVMTLWQSYKKMPDWSEKNNVVDFILKEVQ